MALADPQAKVATIINLYKLNEEIAVADWMDVFAAIYGIVPLLKARNNGAMGPMDEVLGRGSPNSGWSSGEIIRFSAIGDGSNIYYVLSGGAEAAYLEFSQQLACISLYFKLDNPMGPKLA